MTKPDPWRQDEIERHKREEIEAEIRAESRLHEQGTTWAAERVREVAVMINRGAFFEPVKTEEEIAAEVIALVSSASVLTFEEQRALGIALRFRIELLKSIEADALDQPRGKALAHDTRVQIDALASAAEKLDLP